MDDYVAGNWVAYIALVAWPIIALGLFATLQLREAIIWTALGALLILPAQVPIKIPMIPAIDKNSMASVGILFGCLLFSRKTNSRIRAGLPELLMAFYVLGPLATSALNGDALLIGNRVVAGVGLYDGASAAISQAIFFLPFIIGRRYLNSFTDNVALLRALSIGGLLLSFPMLFEIRMSPQLANWIYGYFPSSFAVEMRSGGFRPVVFMNNGLSAAFFLTTALIATFSLWGVRLPSQKIPPAGLAIYLGGVLLLCKSAGALIYGVAIGPLVRWTSAKVQVRIAVVLVSIALLYPVLRISGFFPTDSLLSLAESYNRERSLSLKFRFDNEAKMLTHAEQRIFFGWGRYGRNRVFNEELGWETVTDGLWIITFGQYGLVGFIGQFGLFILSVYRTAGALRRVRRREEQLLLAGLSMIVALTAVEQLPNASISPWTWLLSGSLLGRAEAILRATRVQPNTMAPPRNSPGVDILRPNLT